MFCFESCLLEMIFFGAEITSKIKFLKVSALYCEKNAQNQVFVGAFQNCMFKLTVGSS